MFPFFNIESKFKELATHIKSEIYRLISDNYTHDDIQIKSIDEFKHVNTTIQKSAEVFGYELAKYLNLPSNVEIKVTIQLKEES